MSFFNRFSRTPQVNPDEIRFHIRPDDYHRDDQTVLLNQLFGPQNGEELYNFLLYTVQEYSSENVIAALCIRDMKTRATPLKMMFLVRNYLNTGAPYEVNIPQKLRTRWDEFQRRPTGFASAQYATLQDDTANAVQGNILDTWSRYSITYGCRRYNDSSMACPRVPCTVSLDPVREQIHALEVADIEVPARLVRMAQNLSAGAQI